MSDTRYPTRMHEVLLDEMPDDYPETYFEKADYALFCLHKVLGCLSPALGRISRLCGLLRIGEKDGKNTLPDIITHNESRMALRHLIMVKRDIDDAYQEILSIFENTKEPGTVSKTESVGQGPEPGGMRNDLKAAVDELEALKTHYDIQGPGAEEGTECHLICSSIDTALDALRDALKRQPDPATGLVNCGCGGVAEELFDGFSFDGDGMECNDYLVKCQKCGMQTQVIQTWSEKARDIWNTAMGWKGGAE